MARGWANDYFDDFLEPSPNVQNILFGSWYQVDGTAQELFMERAFNGNEDALERLRLYLYQEYGIDLDDSEAWEDFRNWYERA